METPSSRAGFESGARKKRPFLEAGIIVFFLAEFSFWTTVIFDVSDHSIFSPISGFDGLLLCVFPNGLTIITWLAHVPDLVAWAMIGLLTAATAAGMIYCCRRMKGPAISLLLFAYLLLGPAFFYLCILLTSS